MTARILSRRQAIPVLYTRGTHYDVGFDMGRTFASIIKTFLQLSQPLNECYVPLYNTEAGKKAYNETLESVKKSFPQYIRELEGVADGAQVEFYKLFLLHMDEITPQACSNGEQKFSNQESTGCSTIIVNKDDCKILGHTEDALQETLNNYYFVMAHIICDTPQGKYQVKEERFMSLCYAGHLPGYTMNYNHHGLVFSINTLSADKLKSGKTPRHFLARSLLGAENFEQVKTILKDVGVGAGDGCSINLTFLKDNGPQQFYNIEMGPTLEEQNQSQLDIKEILKGEYSCHANKYLRLPCKDINQLMTESSIARMNVFCQCNPPKSKKDVIDMLGDESNLENPVFRDTGVVKTIAVGVFDLIEKTYTLYSDNPKTSEPHVVIPLVLKK